VCNFCTEDRQCTYNVTLCYHQATTVANETQNFFQCALLSCHVTVKDIKNLVAHKKKVLMTNICRRQQ